MFNMVSSAVQLPKAKKHVLCNLHTHPYDNVLDFKTRNIFLWTAFPSWMPKEWSQQGLKSWLVGGQICSHTWPSWYRPDMTRGPKKPGAYYTQELNLGIMKCYAWEHTRCNGRLWQHCLCKFHWLLGKARRSTFQTSPFLRAGSKERKSRYCQLLTITVRQSLLNIPFSATLFLHSQQVSSAAMVNHKTVINVSVSLPTPCMAQLIVAYAIAWQSRYSPVKEHSTQQWLFH
jgi:hypothetical protein